MLNQPNDCLPFCVSYPDWARAIFISPLNVSLSLALARHVICNLDTEFEWSSGRWILVGINRSNIPSLCCVSGYLIAQSAQKHLKLLFFHDHRLSGGVCDRYDSSSGGVFRWGVRSGLSTLGQCGNGRLFFVCFWLMKIILTLRSLLYFTLAWPQGAMLHQRNRCDVWLYDFVLFPKKCLEKLAAVVFVLVRGKTFHSKLWYGVMFKS